MPLRTVNERAPNGLRVLWAERQPPYNTQDARVTIEYPCCGRQRVVKVQWLKQYRRPEQSLCDACAKKQQRGEEHHNWQGGRHMLHGYVLVHLDTLSAEDRLLVQGMTRTRKYYVPEHRLVMARQLGRPLTRTEHVHHLNGLKRDNRPNNLQILSPHAHARTYYELRLALDVALARIAELEAIIQQRSL